MSLTVVCPSCQASFQAKEEWAGKRTKCPKCGGAITIGGALEIGPRASQAAAISRHATVDQNVANDAEKPAESGKVVGTSHSEPSQRTEGKQVAKPVVKAKRLSETGHGPPPVPPPMSPVAYYDPSQYGAPPVYGPPAYPPPTPYAAGYAPPAGDPYAQPIVPTAMPQSPEPMFAVDVNATASRPAVKSKAAPSAKLSAAGPAEHASSGGPSTGSGRKVSPIVYAGAATVAVVLALGSWFLFRGGDDSLAEAVADVSPATADVAAPSGPALQSTASSPTGQDDLADVVERLKKGIVLITLMDGKGDTLGLGTGFLVDNRGHVVTNYHVIKGGARATVRYSTGVITEVKGVSAVDESRDLAIVQLEFTPDDATPLSLRPDAALRQGTKVIAIGHPHGLDYSVSEGIVSALRTTAELPNEARIFLEAPENQQWIQTTAAISGGNSGGPLMLPDGDVIGINTWVAGGENLGFAGHVRHVVDLKAKVGVEPLATLTAYNEAHGGLERAIVDQIDAFSVGYGEILKQAEAIDWQPTSDENKELIRQAAGGTAFSRPRGLMTKELDELGRKLSARNWDYAKHVRALNDFAIEILTNDPGRVMFFGKVVHTFRETHVCRVQIVDRGYFVDVYEFVDPKKHKNIGETLLVMGMRPPGLETPIQRVASGLVVPVQVPMSSSDTTLRQMRDFVHFRVECDQKPELLSAPRQEFPQVRFASGADSQTAYTVTLNQTGQGFDALRLLSSAAAADDDVVWAVVVPHNAIRAWGITSVDGLIPVGVDRFVTIEDYQPANLTLPPRNKTLLVHVSGQELKDSRRHLLWFEFTGDKPVELTLLGRYRSRFTARPQKAQLFESLGLPEVGGLETRSRQFTLSKTPIIGTPGDDLATLQSIPVVAVPRTSGVSTPMTPATVATPTSLRPAPRAAVAVPTSPASAPVGLKRGPLSSSMRIAGSDLVLSFGTISELSLAVTGRYTPPGSAQIDAARKQCDWLRSRRASFAAFAPPLDSQGSSLMRWKLVSPGSTDDGEIMNPAVLIFNDPIKESDVELLRSMSLLTLVALRNTVVTNETAAAVATIPRLKYLVVQNVPVGDAAVKRVGESSSLEVVLYEFTNVTNAGVAGLRSASQIKVLSLRGTEIDNGALQHLATMFNLEFLDLSDTHVNEAGMTLLTKLSKLRTLALSRLNIGAAGLAKLKTISSLKQLNLVGNPLSDTMVTQLTQMQQLRTLWLTGCNATDAQLDRLKVALPSCEIMGR